MNKKKTDSMFFIKKLECKYENTTVFSAENIDIPRGEITVILGPSGSGKSTFIEALGLMNKTMTDNSEVYFYPNSKNDYKYINNEAEGVDLNLLWKRKWGKHAKAREEIRYKGYSFVFQDTYLMPNFSAIENIALTDLIKGTKLQESYYKIIKGLIKSLHLQNLFFNNRPSSYSGGERQRMAFGRGIFPDFEMLFGDEPTGNLDPHNATEVLRYAEDNISKEGNKEKSALIVTHSIDLALQFANKILILTPKEKINSKKKFTVLPDFTFYKDKDWTPLAEGEESNSNFELFKNKIDFLIDSNKGDLVLEMSEKIVGASLDEKEKIFKDYMSKDEKSNQENKDDLIRKVVAEIPYARLRNKIIENFSIEDGIEIDYLYEVQKAKNKEEEEKKNLPNKPLLKRLIISLITVLSYPVQFLTLYFFHSAIRLQFGVIKQFRKNLKKLSPDFLYIFIYNELREFLGRKFPRNFIFVLFIQFLIFYLIGTANGILDFVAQQDKNPFVKVINISSSYDGIEASMKKVASEIDLADYGIDTITYFKQETNHFNPVNERPDSVSLSNHFDKDNFQLISVKSMQAGDPMRNYILDNTELNPYGSDFCGNDDFSVIVTRNFLKRLGQKDSCFVIRSINNASRKSWQPLPIRGLVDQLPGDADMLCLDNLWASISNDKNWSLLDDKLALWIKMDSTLLFDKFDPLLMNELKIVAEKFGVTINIESTFDDILFTTIENKSIQQIREIADLYELRVGAPRISMNDAEELFSELMNRKAIINFLKENKISLDRIQLSYLNTIGSGGNIDYNNANIYVNSFKRIYEFSDKVYNISGLRLDMAKIERIRNYRIVASVTSLLSVFLIIFSILIIIILLSNILSNHLNKIRKNIGLLMAFGVNTKIIYQSIMITFILITLILGAFLSNFVGYHLQVNKWLFETVTGFVLPNFSGFKISWAYISNSTQLLKYITNPTYITISLMLLFNFIRFNFIINKIFKETPGNLIYDKSNKG